MKTVTYRMESGRIARSLCIALASDLHDRDGSEALRAIERRRPDLICIAGDLTQRLDLPEGASDPYHPHISHENAFSFLRGCAAVAPTFYSLGNHEMGSCHTLGGDFCSEQAAQNLHRVAEAGAVLLNGTVEDREDIAIGGVGSGYFRPDRIPDLRAVDRLERREGLRILLCHHPEYYPRYLKDRGIDLILSGHAHGGQIRLFGRGLFAPGQGILPRYAGGMYDRKLIVGRGLSNTVKIPRLFNPTEMVFVEVVPK